MSTKAEQQSSPIDTLKLVVALLLLLLGIAGFYYFASWQGEPVSLLYRVLGLLAIAGVAAYIAFTTASGQRLAGFMQDARTEVRKMVWPTRAETIQTTMIVLVMVVIIAIFLWLIDMAVFKIIYDFLLGVDG